MTAKHAAVLTPADVNNIRGYVRRKYAALTAEKRAEIVADAIDRIIQRKLPEFDAGTKQRLSASLIRSAVLEQRRSVRASDIYLLCMELNMEDSKVAVPFQHWLHKQQRQQGWLPTHPSSPPLAAAAEGGLAIPSQGAMPAIVKQRRRAAAYKYGLPAACLIAASLLYGHFAFDAAAPEQQPVGQAPTAVVQFPLLPDDATAVNELPEYLRYRPVDEQKLLAYLEMKSSLLTERRHFDAIIAAADQFDIHPALLFAITGQEQGFVPRSHERSEEIGNNPFNVFHSWQHFNTTIEQSAEIAARTIARLSKDRPPDTDPIEWINREYAEDPNWSTGVRSIFNAINNYMVIPQEEPS